ncbi:MAG: hypothetical protein R3B40_21290 [Polyangiales bacterium]
MDLSPRSRVALMALVVTAVPTAWAAETALRAAFFPADFEQLRELLRPTMSAAARGLVVLTVVLVVPSYVLMRHLARRRLRVTAAWTRSSRDAERAPRSGDEETPG